MNTLEMEKYTRKIKLISAVILRMIELMMGLEVILFVTAGDASHTSFTVNFYITLIVLIFIRMLAGYYFLTLKNFKKISWIYCAMFVVMSLFALSYFFLYLFLGHPDKLLQINLCQTLAYMVGNTILLCFNMYYLQYFGVSRETRRSLKIFMIVTYIASLLYYLSNSFTHQIFAVLPDGNIYFPEHYYLGYAYAVLSFALNTIGIISTKLDGKTKNALLSLMYFPALTIILDYCSPSDNLSDSSTTAMLGSLFVVGPLMSMYAILFHVYVQNNLVLAEREKELTETQAQLMVSQIQPHFLFNTLTAIYQLCDYNPKLAQKTIDHFSMYLRQNINSINEKEPIPFEQELKHVETYLEIEKLRFSDILSVEYDIQYKDFRIPALSLQVLVENAVKYGIRSNEDGGTVSIRTFCQNGSVYVVVHDDGQGFDPDAVMNDGKQHYGIKNARIRIENMCHGELLIDSRPGGSGTTAAIILDAEVAEDVEPTPNC